MPALLLTLLFTVFPSSSQTSWMRPDAFHLSIGMSRFAALGTLRSAGYDVKPGKQKGEMFVDYTADKTMTLHFNEGRLWSVRFELFTFLPDVPKAFEELRADLRKDRGEPKKLSSKSILVYDDTVPNVMVVMSNDIHSANGRKGIGYVVVRYYDPK